MSVRHIKSGPERARGKIGRKTPIFFYFFGTVTYVTETGRLILII